MNSLQTELNKVNEQLDLLTYRKTQLDAIITEYSDVVNRVKNLVGSMIEANVEPLNLMLDIQDLVNLDDLLENEPTTQPKPIQKDWADDWVEVSTSAHNEDGEVEMVEVQAEAIDSDWDKVAPNVFWRDGVLKVIVPWVNVETLGEVDDLCNQICHEAKLATSYEIELLKDNWLIYFSVAGCETSFDSIIDLFFPEPDPTPQPVPTAPCSFPVRVFAMVPGVVSTPGENIKTTLKKLHDNGVKAILKGELLANHFNSLTANELEQHLEKLAEQGLINLGDSSINLKFPEVEPPSEYQLTNTVGWQYFAPRAYFKDDTLKLFIPRKSRYRKELEAISKTCATILMIGNKREVHEVGDDWIVILNPVYDCAIQAVIDEFYPTRKDWTEPTPKKPTEELQQCPKCNGAGVDYILTVDKITSHFDELDCKELTCSACGGTGRLPIIPNKPEEIKQINMQAYRRGDDHLLIGFNNKRLLNTWSKWFKSNWSDRINISEVSNNLEGFSYCLTVLWFGFPDWERLTRLNYALKPTEQNKNKAGC